jgi:hypothetical protein
MKNNTIPYRRLLHQNIHGGSLGPEQVVKRLGALQAQDYHQALWAIGSRAHTSTAADIEQAIEDRKILLTWPMRGTIHFVPAEDVRWMLKLTASRILAQDKRRLEQLELNQEIIEQCKLLIHDALRGGKRITRPLLMQLLEKAGIGTKNQRGYHLLWHIAQSGLICMGPREGKHQTFVLLEEWVPEARELSMSEALALLAERYFTSHGPATVYDFAWWAGITLTDARQGLEAVQSRLVSETAGNQVYWEAASLQDRKPTADEPAVYLLPGYDEYLLGYKDRSAVLSAENAPSVVPGNNGVFMPIIVIDGQTAGIWKRTIKKKGIDLEFQLFAPQQDRSAAIMEAAERYCAFMGLPMAEASFKP